VTSEAAAERAGASRGRLLQALGVTFGLAVIIGNTIAAGILRTPGQIAAELPNGWLFLGVWVVGGLYALLGALSIAELGVVVPKSGGQYVFARHALGEYAGFVVGWSDWISTCGTTAAVSIVIAEYSAVLFPALVGRETALAAAIILFFAAVQWHGVSWGSRVQNITSLLKAFAFLVVIIACFAFGGGSVASAAPIAPPAHGMLVGLIIALQAVVYTYDGWAGMIYFSEELKDPGREIPKALFGGVLAIIAIYVLVNAALLYVLPISAIAGNNLAMGTAAQTLFGTTGEWTFRGLMVVAMLSGINAYHLMASRVIFAMSRDRLFPSAASRVNAGGTPTVALALSTIVALFFLTGTFDQVIAALAFFFVASYTVSFVSVFVLRRREPEAPRPYKALGYPWTTGLSLVLSVAFLALAIATDTTYSSLYALGVLVASFPVFLVMKRLAAR
jgi:basic amino acid/polyamine antiporter, APA family